MENYIVSARKYRPATFSSVVGQKALTETLKNAVATHRLAHSYLFCGPRGVGKTSCARIFAKTINCTNLSPEGEVCNECESCKAFNSGSSMNIVELDAASNNSVDDIRELVKQVQTPPADGRYRVFIVDEVHMLSSQAFNAFLKTLEEPPSYVVFILATTEKHKIIPTILSRCQIYDFHRITIQDMIDHLAFVAKSEGIEAETSALNVIARKADGAMRDALSIFDQVAASSRGNITYRAAIDNLNVLDSAYYGKLMDCFLNSKVLDSWVIYKEIRDKGFDSLFFINGLGAYIRDLMVAQSPATLPLIESGDEEKAALVEMGKKCTPDFLYKAMCLCNEADLNYRQTTSKQFLIELTLAKICQLCSPSPTKKGGNGEGLAHIAANTGNVAAPVAAVTPKPLASAAPQPQVQPTRPAAPKPIAPPPSPVTNRVSRPAGVPHISIKTSIKNQPTEQQAVADDSTVENSTAGNASARRKPVDREKLLGAWREFAASRPTQHILVNTMRASLPAQGEQASDEWIVTVENSAQQLELNKVMNDLQSHLRSAVENDMLTITVTINTGETSRRTWNDREVMARLIAERPEVKKFVNDFKLILD